MAKRILLTGGGSGGHLFPLLAVADSIIEITKGEAEIIYLGPRHPLNEEFRTREIKVYTVAAGKLRRYFDLANFLDIPKVILGFIQSLFILYWLMPDVVFSKGGTGALPVVVAAKFYFIPVIIHESDSIPGLTNRFSAPLAKRIGISFRSAAAFFSPKKTALVGNPVRRGLLPDSMDSRQAKITLQFNPDEPLILVLGGSQGAAVINNFIVNNLELLLTDFQVYHQTGPNNEEEVRSLTKDVVSPRYKLAGFLNLAELRTALNAADVVICRAGSNIFEIAVFGKPAILIPLIGSANNHQLYNAYEYAENGAAVVVEEANFTANIVLRQIKDVLGDKQKREQMAQAAKAFAKPNAAQVIAEEILKLAA